MTNFSRRFLLRSIAAAAALAGIAAPVPSIAQSPERLRIDWATYNPLSMLLREKGWVEEEFGPETEVTWVQSAGSNKALEFLSGNSIDFGSTAGAASLVGRINGNPIKAIYSYSVPEWTALVTRADTDIESVADLKGRSVAVTRGTDTHIFLIRALAEQGLTERDIRPVLLQHADGKTALLRGDVDAWAGLDPMMAAAEIEDGARLFYRNPAANSYGILNVREEFLADHPDIVDRVLALYERARVYAAENPEELKQIVGDVTGLGPDIIARQIDERTAFDQPRIGAAHRETILAAGLALQEVGVIDGTVDVPAMLDELLVDALPAS